MIDHVETALLSMIVPAYNQAQFLPQALDSLLNQTYKNLEIIVVNDGSTDNTMEVLRTYESRVKIIHQANRGLAGARNRGLREARGNG